MQNYSSLAGCLAENLLEAWLSADPVKIQRELERSISAPLEARDTGEQERRQVLHAVASRMSRCPDLLEAGTQTPEMNLYTHLLFSLSVADKVRN